MKATKRSEDGLDGCEAVLPVLANQVHNDVHVSEAVLWSSRATSPKLKGLVVIANAQILSSSIVVETTHHSQSD